MATELSHIESLSWQELSAPGWDGVREKALVGASKEFVFGLVEARPGARVPFHAHRQAETDYVVAGSATLRTSGRTVDVRQGSCLYFAPGAPHELEVVGADPLVYLRTFACERIGPPVQAIAVADGPEPLMTTERDVDWRSVEPSKGMRIRVQRLLDHGVEVMAGVGELDSGVHYTRHYHDQPELYFILGGEGVLQGAEDETEIGPGTAVYLRSREVHGIDSVGHEPLRLFWVYGCETAGHRVNWTPVEPIYAEARRRLAAR
jgi:quercetin dioxygenase-like cupin family protein